MKIIRLAQSIEYLTNVLGIDLQIAESILPLLTQMDKTQRKFYIKNIKDNIQTINNSHQLITNPNYLQTLFPFQNQNQQFHPLILNIFQNQNERIWVQNLINSKKIIPEEDIPKISNMIQELKEKPNSPQLESFKDDSELFYYLSKNKETEFNLPEKGYKILGNDNVEENSVQLLEVDRDGIEEIGKDTNWCVAQGVKYDPDRYYCFIINGKPEVLVHPESNQIKDTGDRPLNSYYIKYINNLLNKFNLNTRSGDFETYNKSLEKIKELDENKDNKEFLKSEIDKDVNVISLFPLEIVDNYLKDVVNKIDRLYLEFLTKQILEKIGKYINVYNLPERSYLDDYVINVIDENYKSYLKETTPSLRTKEMNDIYNNISNLDNLSDSALSFLIKYIEEKGHPPFFAKYWAKRKLENGEAPQSWINKINKFIEEKANPPNFAYDWAKRKLENGEAPQSWINYINKFIEEKGEASPFAYHWAKRKLENGEAHKSLINGINKFIEEKGYSPNFAYDWARRKLENGEAPQSWINKINKFIEEKGSPPSFAEDWAKRKLKNGEAPQSWINGINKFIEKNSCPPNFAYDWAKRKLENGEAPQSWINYINKFIEKKGHTPSFAKNWYKKQQEQKEIQAKNWYKFYKENKIMSPSKSLSENKIIR